jgi:hypothetical protein
MKNWLRSFWLHTLYVLKIALTRCEVCGVLGASSCSIAQCTKLCGDCQLEVNMRLDAFYKSRDAANTRINGVYVRSKQFAPFGHWSKRR